MSNPLTYFGSENRVTKRSENTDLRITPRTDVQWGRPLFKAPALATPRQREEELRFAADFRTKDWLKR
jgi:hypothetical protein